MSLPRFISARALVPFVAVVGLAAGVLVADQWRLKPVPIPAPSSADSLAGVVARLTHTDSAQIARVTWKESPERWLGLNWISTDPYRYRDSSLTGNAPIAAQADLRTWTITFAKGQVSATIIKHELAHLFLNTSGHPAAIFHAVETYRN